MRQGGAAWRTIGKACLRNPSLPTPAETRRPCLALRIDWGVLDQRRRNHPLLSTSLIHHHHYPQSFPTTTTISTTANTNTTHYHGQSSTSTSKPPSPPSLPTKAAVPAPSDLRATLFNFALPAKRSTGFSVPSLTIRRSVYYPPA